MAQLSSAKIALALLVRMISFKNHSRRVDILQAGLRYHGKTGLPNTAYANYSLFEKRSRSNVNSPI